MTPGALFTPDMLMKRNLTEKSAKGTGRLAKKAAPKQPENNGNAPKVPRGTSGPKPSALNAFRKKMGQPPL